MLRKLDNFITRYGPVAGPKLYHALQSQAAHAGVSARLRRKLGALERGEPWPPSRRPTAPEVLPLFPDETAEDREPSGNEPVNGGLLVGASTVDGSRVDGPDGLL